MIFNRYELIAVLLLFQFLICDALAQQESDSGVSDVVKQGEQVILEQKKQLGAKGQPKETTEKQAVSMPEKNLKEETGTKR